MKFRRLCTSYLLIVLIVFFAACGGQSISAAGEYAFLNGAAVPSGYSVKENPEGGYLIYQEENVIGGIQLLDLTEASKSDDYLYHLSDHLIAAAEAIAAGITPADYDHMTSTSEYAYMEISFVSAENDFYHYIFQVDSAYCDLWFDRSQISHDKDYQFIKNLFGYDK